jgi:hypothetical protein
MGNFYSTADASTCQAKNMFDGSTGRVFTNPFIDILVKWHTDDPVSAKELAINNDIYYNHQSNRNPYIDHPEYVGAIWNSFLSNNSFELENSFSIYPNPTNNGTITINTNLSIDAIQVISINGQLINDIKNPVKINETYTLDNLPKGFYFLKLTSNSNSVTKKISVN